MACAMHPVAVQCGLVLFSFIYMFYLFVVFMFALLQLVRGQADAIIQMHNLMCVMFEFILSFRYGLLGSWLIKYD